MPASIQIAIDAMIEAITHIMELVIQNVICINLNIYSDIEVVVGQRQYNTGCNDCHKIDRI
jgi:hypothetical protein